MTIMLVVLFFFSVFGMQNDYVACTSTATAEGHTYTNRIAISSDVDQPVDPEHRWQREECKRINEQQVVNIFLALWRVEIDKSIVSTTYELP